MAPSSRHTDRDSLAAEQAMQHVLRGELEQAALHLHRQLGSRVMGFLRRHRVPESDAEELLSDVWMKFIRSRCDEQIRPVVWLWTIVQSVLVDWVRERGALKRGGSGQERLEVLLNDDVLDVMVESIESAETPGWLKLCIERAAHQLERDDPNRAHVLWLWYSGQSAADIAVVFGASPPPTPKQETAARNRVLEATRKARDYFEHCRD
ncbi:sigma-70 family RNA polymerase sigma factor [Diaphorobacter sp. HDW4B]|uniref:sigma-70 family RNA polymerase sigma factor n=1 Tax=Diaphorobacter sp. HDW4B TaxID=2714925 RepID=UPI00140A385C|nr:sigma-70 family RNA polymerase sigma factor [Diaphorobacter sp. HDW4B]QIL73085.1 sigma-70 family RNA polymerase sigma factor [Diaphorobacter sp. HDW4B]